MDYTVIRSNRRTIAIHIKEGVGVEVRAPKRTSKREIDTFVASKANWIAEKLALVGVREESKRAFLVDYGKKFLLSGLELEILGDVTGTKCWADERGFHFPPRKSPEELKLNIKRIYRGLAERHLPPRAKYFADKIGVEYEKVKITSAKTNWGSCSSRKNINFSWRLIMAEPDAIDYVIVHELAHLREMNHSPKFWEIVEGVLPDYKRRQTALKTLQARLSKEDWDG